MKDSYAANRASLNLTRKANQFQRNPFYLNANQSEGVAGGLKPTNNMLVLAPLIFEKSLQITSLKLKTIRQTNYHCNSFITSS